MGASRGRVGCAAAFVGGLGAALGGGALESHRIPFRGLSRATLGFVLDPTCWREARLEAASGTSWAVQDVRRAAREIFRVRLGGVFSAIWGSMGPPRPGPRGGCPVEHSQLPRALPRHPRPSRYPMPAVAMRGNPGAFGETSHQGLGPFKALHLPIGIGDSCAWGHGAGAYGAVADTERHASALARAWCHRRQFF